MPPSALWEISVQTTLEAADAIGELLTRIFGPSTSAYTDFDTGDTCVSLILKRAPGRRADWRRQLREGLRLIRRCGLEIGKGTVGSRRLPGRDWAESWKRHFHPLEVSSRLMIRPSWSRKRPRKGQRVLVLDPGLSFGTGQHPTTEFCLREIASFRGAAQPQS